MNEPITELQVYADQAGPEKGLALAETFNPFMRDVESLTKAAALITVDDASDVEGMTAARETRLALRSIRVDVEKKRKALKESCLREGKAIDGMANVIKYVIQPVEDDLQAKEDTAKRIREEQITRMVQDRAAQLEAVDVDWQHFNLAEMPLEAFEALLQASTLAYKAELEAQERERAKLAAEVAAQEKADAEREAAERVERERIEAENAELRKAKAAAEKQAAEERKAREEAEQAAKAEREAAAEEERKREFAERERKAKAEQAELDRLKAEKAAIEAAKAAPDAIKLQMLIKAITTIEIPAVESETAMAAITAARTGLNKIYKALRKAENALASAGEDGE